MRCSIIIIFFIHIFTILTFASRPNLSSEEEIDLQAKKICACDPSRNDLNDIAKPLIKRLISLTSNPSRRQNLMPNLITVLQADEIQNYKIILELLNFHFNQDNFSENLHELGKNPVHFQPVYFLHNVSHCIFQRYYDLDAPNNDVKYTFWFLFSKVVEHSIRDRNYAIFPTISCEDMRKERLKYSLLADQYYTELLHSYFLPAVITEIKKFFITGCYENIYNILIKVKGTDEENHPHIQYLFGSLLEKKYTQKNGFVIPARFNKACEYYFNSAKNNFPVAALRLGKILLTGIQDNNNQFIIRQDVNTGQAILNNLIKDCYHNNPLMISAVYSSLIRQSDGKLIAWDEDTAFKNLKKAAELNFESGILDYAHMLTYGYTDINGNQVKADVDQAIRILRGTNIIHNGQGNYELAKIYYTGYIKNDGSVIGPNRDLAKNFFTAALIRGFFIPKSELDKYDVEYENLTLTPINYHFQDYLN